jgi:hypothetical protein
VETLMNFIVKLLHVPSSGSFHEARMPALSVDKEN